MKRLFAFVFVSLIFSSLFALDSLNESSSQEKKDSLVSKEFDKLSPGKYYNIEKFIKGNLHEKTVAVREASGEEAVWLCDRAIFFVLESKQILETDRELDGLAVAAVLSFPYDYVRNASERAKEIVVQEYITVFESFSSSPNVQITVISKLNSLSRELNLKPFVSSLNDMLSGGKTNEMDLSVIKSALNFLSVYGNKDSFVIAYNMWSSKKFESLKSELENCIISLIPVSMNEAVAVTNNSSLERVCTFFDLINKYFSKIPENSFCELAENVLKNSILLVRKNQKTVSEVTSVQTACVSILSDCHWTRASSVMLDFFEFSKELFENESTFAKDSPKISEEDFACVIKSLANTAPFDSVPALIAYLESLNARVEKFEDVSETVALAVINTLGAIGDKAAFDTLLGVTYFAYPQTVLAAAREALSGLKW